MCFTTKLSHDKNLIFTKHKTDQIQSIYFEAI